MSRYLEQAGIPQLQRLDLLVLNAPITEEALTTTIKALPSHKSPGPNGLPYEYYKSFLPLLLPNMSKLFNAFLQQTPIPSDMQRSFLTLIPKPDNVCVLMCQLQAHSPIEL